MKNVLTLLLIVTAFYAFPQNKSQQNITLEDQAKKTDRLEKRIDKLTIQVDSLKINVSDANETFVRAEKVYKVADEVYQKAKDSISITNWYISLLLAFSAFIIAALGYSYTQAKKKMEQNLKVQEERYLAQIAEITNKSVSLIKTMVSKHNKEQFLLSDTRILIINKSGTTIDVKFKMVLKRFNNTPTIIDTYDFTEISESFLIGFDVVILDNLNYGKPEANWNFSTSSDLKSKLTEFAKIVCSGGNAFLYFGDPYNDGKFADKLVEFNHLINFANKPATLFANLIDLLDFRRLLNEKTV